MNSTKAIIDALSQLGLSQAEITRRTGIPQSRISRWSNGKTPPGADDALKLLDLKDKLRSSKKRKPKAEA